MQQFLVENLWCLNDVCVVCTQIRVLSVIASADIHGFLTQSPSSAAHLDAESLSLLVLAVWCSQGCFPWDHPHTLFPNSPPGRVCVAIFRRFLLLEVEKSDVGRAKINPSIYPYQFLISQQDSWLENNIYKVFSFQKLYQAVPDQTRCGSVFLDEDEVEPHSFCGIIYWENKWSRDRQERPKEWDLQVTVMCWYYPRNSPVSNSKMPKRGETAATCSCEPDLGNGVGLLGLVLFFPLNGQSAELVPPVVGCVIVHKFLHAFVFFPFFYAVSLSYFGF